MAELENDSRGSKALLPGPVGRALMPILQNGKLDKLPTPEANVGYKNYYFNDDKETHNLFYRLELPMQKCISRQVI